MSGVDINFANALCEPFSENIKIYLAIKSADRIAVAQTLSFTSYGEGEVAAPSPLTLTRPAAQILMDALWRCDVRPSTTNKDQQTYEALRDHLQDMRRLVFETPNP